MLSKRDALTFLLQTMSTSVLTVTCRGRSCARESHENTLRLHTIRNTSIALAEHSVHVRHQRGHVRKALLSQLSLSNRHMITGAYQVIRLQSCAIMYIRGLAAATVLHIWLSDGPSRTSLTPK